MSEEMRVCQFPSSSGTWGDCGCTKNEESIYQLPSDEVAYDHWGDVLASGKKAIVSGGEEEVKILKTNDENDVSSIDFVDEEEQGEEEGEAQMNMVKVGEREVDTYANMAQRFLQQYGSVVIGARGNWCGKAIMVIETMREMGFIIENQKPQIEIGMDTMENGKAGNVRSRIAPYRKPYIRITVSRKGYFVDTFDL